MSVVIESLEGRSLLSASPALVDLRADVATFKVELISVKKALTAEVKTLTADLKREKATTATKALLMKSLTSSVTVPEAQLTASLSPLISKAATFVSAADVYAVKITAATTLRYQKAQAALNTAYGKENTLASVLYGTRLSTLSTTAVSLATATGDATTEVDANTISASVVADNTSFSQSQATITTDVGSLGTTSEF